MLIATKSYNKLTFSTAFPLRRICLIILFISLAMLNNWDFQYFYLSHERSSISSKSLLHTCSLSWILRYWMGLVSWQHQSLTSVALPHLYVMNVLKSLSPTTSFWTVYKRNRNLKQMIASSSYPKKIKNGDKQYFKL